MVGTDLDRCLRRCLAPPCHHCRRQKGDEKDTDGDGKDMERRWKEMEGDVNRSLRTRIYSLTQSYTAYTHASSDLIVSKQPINGH